MDCEHHSAGSEIIASPEIFISAGQLAAGDHMTAKYEKERASAN